VSWQSNPDSGATPESSRTREGTTRAAWSAAAAGKAGDLLSIGEVCAATRLSPRTVRYYEELGLLPGVRRRAGGRRVYGPVEVERLRFIQRLKALGLTLAEIRELDAVHAIGGSTRAMLGRLDELLARRLAELEQRIGELAGLRDEIGRYRARIAGRLHAAAGEEAS
jgi:DNA-binding transcriptional MerR regulator